MSYRVSIGTPEGYSVREVIYDSSTSLSIACQIDGVTATVSSSTCIAANGDTTVSLTTTNSGGTASVTLTAGNIATLGLNLWDSFRLSWTVTVTDGSVSFTKRFIEICFVAEQEICPSLDMSEVTSAYPELALPKSLPTGRTNWHFKVQDSWREIRNWIDTQTSDRQIWKIENSQSLRSLHLQWTLLNISLLQASMVNSSLWDKRIEYHTKMVDKLKSNCSSWFAVAPSTTFGKENAKDKRTVKAPSFWQGMSSSADFGKL